MNLDIRMMSRDINEMLWKSKKTLSTAESCTAGRVATVLTATPGSSEYYLGGIVCYADKVKEELLGVDKQLIEEKTAVCEEVVRQLVAGANKLFCSDYAVAVSGFAGPGGGTPEIPVGTIWIAVGNEEETVTRKLELDHGRDKNISIATFTAVQMLHDLLAAQAKAVGSGQS